MNFANLTSKYFPSASVIVHDRTYLGLQWLGPGEKPLESIFISLQAEEDRIARQAGQFVLSQVGQMQEKQRQARAQAEEDNIPFQKKLGEYFEEERLKAQKLARDVLELKMNLASKEHVLDAWREITATQDLLNRQAQDYLDATKHYLSWDLHKVPAEVLAKREEAHGVISGGTLVYSEWAALRANEMPSREDLAEAIKKGGVELERMKKLCREVSLKYPRPRKQHF